MLVILIGKCGAGKDTIRAKLSDEGFLPIISATTRSPRPDEVNGRDYFFLSEEEFFTKMKTGQIFEYREFESTTGKIYYGSQIISLDPEKDYVKVLDPEGAKTYIDAYGKNKCFVAEVTVNDELRHVRAYTRQFPDGLKPSDYDAIKNFEEEWKNRLADDNKRFSADYVLDTVNYYLLNERKMPAPMADFHKALTAYKERMKEFEETAHLHTDVVYPHLLVDKISKHSMAAYTEEELRNPPSGCFKKIEDLESLENHNL